MYKFIIYLLLILTISGCVMEGSTSWNYRPNEYKFNKSKPKTIDVIVFSDQRSNYRENKRAKSLIPLVKSGVDINPMPELSELFYTTSEDLPIGECDKQMISNSYKYFKPSVDFASGLVREVKAANYVSEYSVNFLCNRAQSKAHYRIEGKILDTTLKTEFYSYGVSLFYPLAWLAGLSSEKYSINLKLELSLIDGKSNKAIFSKIYTAKPVEIINTMYNIKSLMVYDKMVGEIYNEFTRDIKDKIK